jgi:hypothetical protein
MLNESKWLLCSLKDNCMSFVRFSLIPLSTHSFQLRSAPNIPILEEQSATGLKVDFWYKNMIRIKTPAHMSIP